MQNNFILPVIIQVRPSKWLKIWIYAVHLGSLPALLLTSIPIYIRVLLLLMILCSLYRCLAVHILQRSPESILRIMLNDENEWWISTAGGNTFQAELAPVNLVHDRLVVLVFQDAGKTLPVILVPDAVNSDSLRRLRVRLRFPRVASQ